MNIRGYEVTTALLFLGHVAVAEVCPLIIYATDDMRGKLPVKIMGHNWVLAKTTNVAAVANAGMGAGLANSFQQPGDKRIIASTKIVGGGENAVVQFSTARLERGVSYSYFCSAPGHFSIMKGRFVFNAAGSSSVAQR